MIGGAPRGDLGRDWSTNHVLEAGGDLEVGKWRGASFANPFACPLAGTADAGLRVTFPFALAVTAGVSALNSLEVWCKSGHQLKQLSGGAEAVGQEALAKGRLRVN